MSNFDFSTNLLNTNGKLQLFEVKHIKSGKTWQRLYKLGDPICAKYNDIKLLTPDNLIADSRDRLICDLLNIIIEILRKRFPKILVLYTEHLHYILQITQSYKRTLYYDQKLDNIYSEMIDNTETEIDEYSKCTYDKLISYILKYDRLKVEIEYLLHLLCSRALSPIRHYKYKFIEYKSNIFVYEIENYKLLFINKYKEIMLKRRLVNLISIYKITDLDKY